MERRELLKRGILLGAAVVAEQGTGPEPAAAQAIPVSFFEGELRGRGFFGCKLFLGLTGTRVQGSAAALPAQAAAVDEIRELRLRGRLQGGRLRADVFALEDVNLTRPIGVLEGLLNQYGVLKGSLRLGEATRAFHAQRIPIDPAASGQLVGTYRGSLQNLTGGTLYTGDLTLRPDLTWELRALEAASPEFPMLTGSAAARVAGRWGVARDGRVMVSITQVPLQFRLQSGVSAPARAARVASRRRTGAAPPVRLQGQNPGLVFEDGAFSPLEWSVRTIVSPIEFPDSVTTERPEGGGNPGIFLQVRHQQPDNATIVAAHVTQDERQSFRWERATPADPPIAALRYSFDLIAPPGSASPPEFLPLVIHTPPGGAPTYYAAGAFTPGRTWGRVDTGAQPLGPAWTRIAGRGPEHPDPEGLGLFRFGFATRVASTIETPPGAHTHLGGIDNLRVELGAEEPPPVLVLEGPASVFVIPDESNVSLCYTATIRPTAGPLQGRTVEFISDDMALTQGPVQTDGAGQAQFCVTVNTHVDPEGQRRNISAHFVDEDVRVSSIYIVRAAAGFCDLLCLPFTGLAINPPGDSGLRPAAAGFCLEHPLLLDLLLCAEPADEPLSHSPRRAGPPPG